METTTKLKIKIGNHEFEAEGPAELVREQFESFKQLVSNTPQIQQQGSPQTGKDGDSGVPLDKICRVDGRLISITFKAKSEGDAALVIMLGQKTYRENETVTASEISDGLEQSGVRVGRLDRIMKPLADEGMVVQIGAKKGTRYRLTNQGINRARVIATETIAELA